MDAPDDAPRSLLRLLAWWTLLALLSLADLALTATAARNVPTFEEWNPLAPRAWDGAGVLAGLAAKAAALLGVLVVVVLLRRMGHARAAEWTLGAWCAAFAAVDASSLATLHAQGVI